MHRRGRACASRSDDYDIDTFISGFDPRGLMSLRFARSADLLVHRATILWCKRPLEETGRWCKRD
jgi:hypothetical protein